MISVYSKTNGIEEEYNGIEVKHADRQRNTLKLHNEKAEAYLKLISFFFAENGFRVRHQHGEHTPDEDMIYVSCSDLWTPMRTVTLTIRCKPYRIKLNKPKIISLLANFSFR